jgi:hypothetical protein
MKKILVKVRIQMRLGVVIGSALNLLPAKVDGTLNRTILTRTPKPDPEAQAFPTTGLGRTQMWETCLAVINRQAVTIPKKRIVDLQKTQK